MRGLFGQVTRVVVAAVVVVSLAVPVYAKPAEKEFDSGKFINAVKRFVVKAFGDGLIIPRP